MGPIVGWVALTATPAVSANLARDAQAMLQFDFMRRAFLAGSAVAIVAGLIGYFVVLRRLIFASDLLAHVAFPGALGALIVRLNPLLGAFGFAALSGVGLSLLGERARARDVTAGITLAWVFGVGALLLSIYTSSASAANGSDGMNVLFGSIFGLRAGQARLVAILGGLILVVVVAIARPLLFVSLDPQVAAARGVPVRLLNILFLLLLAAVTAEAVQAVGALLLFALLITPAAIARRLVARPYPALVVSAGLALGFTWAGLVLAFYLPYPVSFFITALVFVAYLGVVLFERLPVSRVAWPYRCPHAAISARPPEGE